MNVQEFIGNIREEKDGFKFGVPWRYTQSSLAAVLPILRKSKEQRQYITLAEAGDKVVIEDSGSISEAIVTNKGNKPVFIRAGEMLKGSTQTRAVVISRVIMPKQTGKVKIVCVYASKGISQGAKFTSAGYAPSSVENTIINEVLKNNGNPSQTNIWGSVHNYSAQMMHVSHNDGENTNILRGASKSFNSVPRFLYDAYTTVDMGYAGGGGSGMDDLEGNMKKFSVTMQELFKSLPKVDWQTGAVLITMDGISGLEVFDLPDSWTAMKEELAEKEAENLIKEDQANAFEFNPKKAKYMAEVLLKVKFSEKDLYKDSETKTIGVDMDKYVGQATLLNDQIIHLNLIRKN